MAYVRTTRTYETPLDEDRDYLGIRFELVGEHDEDDDSYLRSLDGPVTPFDCDQDEAERYCMEVGIQNLWHTRPVREESEPLYDGPDREWTDYLELNDL